MRIAPGNGVAAIFTIVMAAALTGCGGGGGGGAMGPIMVLGLLTLLVVGWRRTRSAFLVSQA